MATPGMAPTDPSRGQPSAAYRSVTLQRFDGVCRAAWRKTAGRRFQRRQQTLVQTHQPNADTGNHAFFPVGRDGLCGPRRGPG